MTFDDIAAWHEREAQSMFRLADRLSDMGDEKAACRLAVSADWHAAAAALIHAPTTATRSKG